MPKENLDNSEIQKEELSFEQLGLNPQVLKGIQEAGFTTPSPIQADAIPAVLQGKDVIAQAQTGTGKTAAFALPIINMLTNDKTVEALIITPTRELAMQISDEVFKLGKFAKTRTICVYGGQSIKKQIEFMQKMPQVMIATPGRLLDHLKNNRFENFVPKIVVLDESDEMLDMGFLDDIEEIFSYLPSNAQILLFSATMPNQIRLLADKILENPINIKITPTNMTNVDISQRFYVINEAERNDAITRLLDTQSPSKSIIFTRTKKEADELNTILSSKGYRSIALHGDMEQRERREAVNAFKANKSDILVATDVASRGLDISDVSHVFNYHIPLNPESYVHRIGRTGRAGKKGVAITLVTPLEYKELKRIQNDIGSKLELYEIPTMNLDGDKVLQNILKVKVSDEVLNIYESLKDKTELSQLCLKLLALHLKGGKIGLSKQEIQKIEEQKSNPKTTRGRDRSGSSDRNKRFSKPSGNSRRGSDSRGSGYGSKPSGGYGTSSTRSSSTGQGRGDYKGNKKR
ncbi:DEAD/DEAH box helicase [Helicobacter cappadocius]|uniref:DEAD/DEAH box helicase n=1 Tax=Helicobacter cappadocius TaxID=3063998 RepID=A0AA90TF03_9HELI|nr:MULTISPECIES: DEAD/DEAH box helicase [unclassified Helicobacter]MDO7253241.1 DEAD/DEAH box helicase [Helicobacter sp. faydin-H75]MDP2539165.1 DEAD/DEAH box helicase [Helicobacter sp. faydin-H76]